jgi:hypothetical protein
MMSYRKEDIVVTYEWNLIEYPDTQDMSPLLVLLLLLSSPSRRRAFERIRLPNADFAEMSTLGSSASGDLSLLAEARAGTAVMIAIDTFMVDLGWMRDEVLLFVDNIVLWSRES